MPVDPGTSPPDDEPVGAVLKRMRQGRRMPGQKLATLIHLSQSTISRIERGVGTPDLDDIRKIARALGADDQVIQDLVQRAERSHDRMTDWRPASAALVSRQKNMADWEAETETICDFQPAVLSGLLQTSGYATATLQLFQRLAHLPTGELTQAATLAAVSARIRRQEILADRRKSFSFVIAEGVLRNPICPPVEMLAQIHHLRNLAARYPNISIEAIPDGATVTIPPLHGFVVFDDKMVEIDVYHTGLISRGRNDVETYRQIFEMFRADARDVGPLLDEYEEVYLKRLRK